MDRMTEAQIAALARPLWESAARPYGAALDFWLMAEQMVLEMMAVGMRFQSTVVHDAPDRLSGMLPETVPVNRIAALAQCMWEETGRQYDVAQDVWLAAERHVLTLLRAASVPERATPLAKWAEDLMALPPEAYLERIRMTAYLMWEAAGRQYGGTLDYWLRAEQEVLGLLATIAGARDEVIDAPMPLDAAEGTVAGDVPPSAPPPAARRPSRRAP